MTKAAVSFTEIPRNPHVPSLLLLLLESVFAIVAENSLAKYAMSVTQAEFASVVLMPMKTVRFQSATN
jgi:hypothetical protein